MKKRSFRLLLLLLMVISMTALLFAACSGGNDNNTGGGGETDIEAPEMPVTTFSYDIMDGGDLSFTVYLNNGTLTGFKRGSETLAAGTDYNFLGQLDKMELKRAYLVSIGVGAHNFEISNEEGSVSFTVNSSESPAPEFDADKDRFYVWGSEIDIAFSADFKGYTLTSLKNGGSNVEAGNYAFTNTSVVIKSSYLEKLCGKQNFTLTLSKGAPITFSVTTSGLFYCDFDEYDVPVESFNFGGGIQKAGNASNRYMSSEGNGGSFLFFNSTIIPGMIELPFEQGKTYKMTFDFKNNLASPAHDMWLYAKNNPYNASVSYKSGTASISGGSPLNKVTSLGSGWWRMEYYFTADTTEGLYMELAPGWVDGASTIEHKLDFDNISVIEVYAKPVVNDNNLVYNYLLDTGDLDISVTYNSDLYDVKNTNNGSTLIKGTDYTVESGLLIIKETYLRGLAMSQGEILTLKIRTVNGSAAADILILNDYEAEVVGSDTKFYVIGTLYDVEFTLNYPNSLSIASVAAGTKTLISGTDYTVASAGGNNYKLAVKGAFIDSCGFEYLTVKFSTNQTLNLYVTTNRLFFSDYDYNYANPNLYNNSNCTVINDNGDSYLDITGNGGDLFGFNHAVLTGNMRLPFEEGASYIFTFDLKSFAPGIGPNGNVLNFWPKLADPEAYNPNAAYNADINYANKTITGAGNKITDIGNGWMRVEIHFTALLLNEGFYLTFYPGYVGGSQVPIYSLGFDNVSIVKALAKPVVNDSNITHNFMVNTGDLNISVTYNSALYDIINVSNGSTLVNGTDYEAGSNVLTVKAAYLSGLSMVGQTLTLKIRTANGFTTADILILNSYNATATGGDTKAYMIGSLSDVEFTLDYAPTMSITSVTAGAKTLVAGTDYTVSLISGNDYKFTVKGAFIDAYSFSYIDVTFSTAQVLRIYVTTNRLFFSDYDDNFIDPNLYNNSNCTIVNDNGNNYLNITGNGGDLFGFNHAVLTGNMKLPFEVGASYVFTFDLKMFGQGIGPNGNVLNFWPQGVGNGAYNADINYDNKTITGVGNNLTDLGGGWMRVEIRFTVITLDGFYLMLYPGYIHESPVPVYNLGFDNVSIIKVPSYYYVLGSDVAAQIDLGFAGISVTGVQSSIGTLVSGTDFTYSSGILSISDGYIQNYNGNLYVLTLSNGKIIEIIINTNRLFMCDFDAFYVNPNSFNLGGVASIAGSSGNYYMNAGTNGGDLFAFNQAGGYNINFETGKTYTLTFDIRNNKADTAQVFTFGGALWTVVVDYKNGIVTGGNPANSISAADGNGWRQVSLTFTVGADKAIVIWPGWENGGVGDIYNVDIDNIRIMEVVS